MAGNQLHANSQLMYYPTHELETYRMLGLIGGIRIKGDTWDRNIMIKDLKEILGDTYNELSAIALDECIIIDMVLYDYLIKNKQYNRIQKYFKYMVAGLTNSNNSDNKCVNPTVTIADLQAGEGDWLNTFTSFIPMVETKPIKLIANELEEERFNKIKADYAYCGSFEDLQLPKESISLLLFNPPYGETNGERNVRRYLRMTIERELIVKSGYILMVIREDDAYDICDIFNKYFSAQVIYKTHTEEHEKYKQVVILGIKWFNPLDEKTTMGARDLQHQIETYIKRLDEVSEFKPSFYNNAIHNLPTVDIELLMENLEYIQSDNIIISQNDGVWSHIRDLTELKDLGEENLVLPKSPKSGEISNLLASGYINGVMDVEGKGNHIVVGGVRPIKKEEVNKYKNDSGEMVTEKKIVRYSKPYLNILISENGKYKIKQLGEDAE